MAVLRVCGLGGRLGSGLSGLAGAIGLPALVDGCATMLGGAALSRTTAGLAAQAAQDLRGQLPGGQFGFAHRGRAIGLDMLHEADGVPNPSTSARGSPPPPPPQQHQIYRLRTSSPKAGFLY